MRVYVLMKCVDFEGCYGWDVYDDEDMAMEKAKELNEEEQSQDYESDVYYTVETHDLIKKADALTSTK